MRQRIWVGRGTGSRLYPTSIYRGSVVTGIPALITSDDKFSCLEEAFVLPVRVLLPQYPTNSVVLPEPDGGIHEQSRQQAVKRMPKGKLLVIRYIGWVLHSDIGILHVWRPLFTVYHLISWSAKKENIATNLDRVDSIL